jgi:hypothetical protein
MPTRRPDSHKNPPQAEGQFWPPQPSFEQPADDDRVWRYLDFPKFVWLLERAALYFARADLLGDPFEGSYAATAKGRLPRGLGKRARQMHYVNCWHLGEHESAAMWRLYSARGAGIAIQSTYARLYDSIPEGALSDPLHFTKVRYIDYDRGSFLPQDDTNAMIAPLIYKRQSFSHERELRIITTNRLFEGPLEFPAGIAIPVVLDLLVEAVYVDPEGPAWLGELVGAVIKRWGLKTIPVMTSELQREPLF